MDDNSLKAFILNKLANLKCWGKKHTSIDNLPKGCPKNLYGKIKDLVRELVKDGFIHTKPTSYGVQVSLNIEKKAEIEEFIKEHYKRK